MNNEAFAPVYALAQDWSRRTDNAMREELKRLGIGYNNELLPSIKTEVMKLANEQIKLETSFLITGRFRDIGAGPGAPGYGEKATLSRSISKLESKERNRDRVRNAGKKKVRYPKKFYSPIYYGRLNALMGVVSGSMVETAVKIATALKTD